ncbi:MAG: hypothetical protein ACKUBY_05325 [Candidatus Moraniibacteriota bacterium]|jgi:small-conductance mechanosensitive channel
MSYLFIMADQPYRVGDFVDIGIRSTRIMTMDDVEIVILNAIYW